MNPMQKRTAPYRLPVRTLLVAAIAAVIFTNACATLDRTAQSQVPDRIMAENSQMKKRIPLIERENDVLNRENLRYKAKLQAARKRIDRLLTDLDHLKTKFDAYTISSQTQIQFLEENYRMLEITSSEQLMELQSRYDALETLRQQEVASLTTQMADQNNAFNEEKDMLKRQASETVALLTSRITELEHILALQEAQTRSLDTANSELSKQLDDVSRQLAESQAQRTQIEKDLQSAQETNAELVQRLNDITSELQSTMDDDSGDR